MKKLFVIFACLLVAISATRSRSSLRHRPIHPESQESPSRKSSPEREQPSGRQATEEIKEDVFYKNQSRRPRKGAPQGV